LFAYLLQQQTYPTEDNSTQTPTTPPKQSTASTFNTQKNNTTTQTNTKIKNQNPHHLIKMSTKTRTLTRRPTTSCYELSITVLRALDLPAADVGGTSDPYCKLLFTNERIGKTKAINYTLNPEWNETFILTIPTQLSTLSPLSTVTVEIWDKDSLSADDLLGSVRLFLPRTSNVEKGWHNLIRPSGGEESNGSVLLSKR
jgi:hypothetical protein